MCGPLTTWRTDWTAWLVWGIVRALPKNVFREITFTFGPIFANELLFFNYKRNSATLRASSGLFGPPSSAWGHLRMHQGLAAAYTGDELRRMSSSTRCHRSRGIIPGALCINLRGASDIEALGRDFTSLAGKPEMEASV
ncbi:hypothetical protein EVAR_67393_1 [Eumeta japonica]|uniref:Uncharacterized protein n=1 Tax=Eumeta variegata TaxID=151549 RepID=A0A4C2A3A2_EUMVA|nr:hypothetical protein EVAR_67393_1 [Eumeta japonica]